MELPFGAILQGRAVLEQKTALYRRILSVCRSLIFFFYKNMNVTRQQLTSCTQVYVFITTVVCTFRSQSKLRSMSIKISSCNCFFSRFLFDFRSTHFLPRLDWIWFGFDELVMEDWKRKFTDPPWDQVKKVTGSCDLTCRKLSFNKLLQTTTRNFIDL